MRSNARVGVVIPALNEEAALPAVLAEIPSWVDAVVVGDNGSTDQTARVAYEAGATVAAAPRRGYGSACLAALAALPSVDIVVFLDADGSDDPAEMPLLVDPIATGQVDLMIGSRTRGGAEAGALTIPQRFGNALACTLLRIWGARFSDLGPFRAIRATTLAGLRMRDPDFGWTVEMQLRAAQRKVRSREVAVRCRRRAAGRSKVSGTLRGVWGAGSIILGTIGRAALGMPLREDRAAFETIAARRGELTSHRFKERWRLLVFARIPKPGKVKTRLIPALGPAGAAKIHAAMTRFTLRWASQLARRVAEVDVQVWYTGGEHDHAVQTFGSGVSANVQPSGHLGQRMEAAFDQAFADGCTRAVVVGTDCPQLNATIGERAFAALADHEAVIAPAFDGGYTLLGLRAIDHELFHGIDWGTATVFAETIRRLKAGSWSYTTLPTLQDVDEQDDLDVWERAQAGPLV